MGKLGKVNSIVRTFTREDGCTHFLSLICACNPSGVSGTAHMILLCSLGAAVLIRNKTEHTEEDQDW